MNEKEIEVTASTKEARDRAEERFQKKQLQAREGALAWKEHEEKVRATREKTARLRSLRLAKEAAEQEAADREADSPPKKKAAAN